MKNKIFLILDCPEYQKEMISIDAEYLMRNLSVIYLISSRSQTVILIENIVRIIETQHHGILFSARKLSNFTHFIMIHCFNKFSD